MISEGDFEKVDSVFASEPFKQYVEQRVPVGESHPTPLDEGSALACIDPPVADMRVRLEERWYIRDREGNPPHVSRAQLEVVAYAIMAHKQSICVEGEVYARAMLLGDGTGVGKTRSISALIREYVLRGNRVAVWITANQDLFEGIEAELIGMELSSIRLTAGLKHQVQEGVILVSYPSLKDKFANLLSILGTDFNGVVVFDEAHLSKRANDGKSRGSQTGLKVVELQLKLKKAKFVYSTATGASEPTHLSYMLRLGIWGDQSCFNNREQFELTADKFGVPFLELMAMDLKRQGVFLARQVSYRGVKIKSMNANVSDDVLEVYRRSCDVWLVLLMYLRNMSHREDDESKSGNWAHRLRQFYSSALRFFASLITSSKIQTVARQCVLELEEDNSVIVALQFTGEEGYKKFSEQKCNAGLPYSQAAHILRTAMRHLDIPIGCAKAYVKGETEPRKIGRWTQEDEENADSLFEAIEIGDEDVVGGDNKPQKSKGTLNASNLISSGSKFATNEDKTKSAKLMYEFEKFESNAVGGYYGWNIEASNLTWSIDQAARICDQESIARLFHELHPFLPINPMDELYCRLQRMRLEDSSRRPGDLIANCTGRSIFYATNSSKKPFQEITFESKAREIKSFQDLRKRIAVISEASSVGVSLHSDKNCVNKQKRIHFTLQWPWSPENLIQQLGRSHRSNQVFPPEYRIVSSPFAAEARFVEVVGQRLRQLGAICHGQSLASPVSEKLAGYMCTNLGMLACSRVSESLSFMQNGIGEIWKEIKLPVTNGKPSQRLFTSQVAKFFNRVLLLDAISQSKVIDMVYQEMENLKDTGVNVIAPIVEYPDSWNDHDITLVLSKTAQTKFGPITFYHFNMKRILLWHSIPSNGQDDIFRYVIKGDIPSVIVKEKESGSLLAYYPFCKKPVPTSEQKLMQAKTIDRKTAEENWIYFTTQARKKPGCVHKATGNICRETCTLNACNFDVGILAGPAFRVFTSIERHLNNASLQLALVTYQAESGNEVTVVGPIVEPSRINSLMNDIVREFPA